MKLEQAIKFLRGKEKVSVREIKEHLKIGYNEASKIVDILENNCIVSKFIGETKRNILVEDSFFDNNFIFLNIDDFKDDDLHESCYGVIY